ncbi:MAG: hypothetical protein ABWJ99_05885 [Caldimicrobium sp.]
MPLKFYQKKTALKALQEKTTPQILGEILHFLLEHLLFEKKFQPSDKDLELLIKKPLSGLIEVFSEKSFLEEKAKEIMINVLKSQAWENLKKLFSSVEEIYYEIEGFYKEENQILRPDLLTINDKTLNLFEIKLHKEDLREDQIELYLSFLREIYPHYEIRAYLFSLDPPELTLVKEIKGEIKKEGESQIHHGSKSLFYSTQLSLFEKFG